MAKELNGKRIAALVAEGFEQVELIEPKKALEDGRRQSGDRLSRAGPRARLEPYDWGTDVIVDEPLETARPDDYDALLLPGGVMSPDRLRMNPKAVDFVRAIVESGKPVAAICHGPWTLSKPTACAGIASLRIRRSRPTSRMPAPMGGRRSGHRSRAGHVAQPGRHPGVQPEDDRGVRRRRAPRSHSVETTHA